MKSLKLLAFTAILGLGTTTAFAHQTAKSTEHPVKSTSHSAMSSRHPTSKSTAKPMVKKMESKTTSTSKAPASK